MTTRFYSRLDLLNAIACILRRSKDRTAYYFDASRPARMLLDLTGSSGRVRHFAFKLAEIRDTTGRHVFPRIFGTDLTGLCDALERETLSRDPLVLRFSRLYPSGDLRSILLFLRKISASKMRDTVVFLHVIAWHRSRSGAQDKNEFELSIERSPFSGVLTAFARTELGLNVVAHLSVSSLCRQAARLAGTVALSLRDILRACVASPGAAGIRQASVAAPYQMKGLTFDPALRSDFPWLLTPRSPRSRTVVVFERPEQQLTPETIALLSQNGVQGVALNTAARAGAVPVFRPGRRFGLQLSVLLARIGLAAVRGLFSQGPRTLHFLPEAVWFARTYAEAHELFRAFGTRVYIDHADSDPYRIARHRALAAQGGVSVSYQLSNWPVPNTVLGSAADVFFLFGPAYRDKLAGSGTANRSVVVSGYFSDASFPLVRERAAVLRKQLTDRGARFIVCYFDENSSDDRMSLIPNGRSALVYRKLLEAVLADPSFGLLCSPKRPKTLFSRLPGIVPLADAARATGRCLIMGGDYCASNYPAEAAQASDVVVSLLIGGTTSLESVLAGVPILYLDLESLYSYPEYAWGRDSLVFDDVDRLLAAVREMRDLGRSFDYEQREFQAALRRKDPFHDGKASERMAGYLAALLEAMDRGDGRDEAIAHADRSYADRWGTEHVLGPC